MLSQELKNLLYVQVEPIYARTYPNLSQAQIMTRINNLAMAIFVLEHNEPPKTEADPNLDEKMEVRITNILKNIKTGKEDAITVSENVIVELFLKNLCYFINKEEFFDSKFDAKSTMSTLYKFGALDLLSFNTNSEIEYAKKFQYKLFKLHQEDKTPILYKEADHPEKTLKDDIMRFPFVQAYCFRNAYTHAQPIPLDSKEILNHFICIFYTMIEAAYKSRLLIIPQYLKEAISYKTYIDNIIEKYESMENFKYISLDLQVHSNKSDIVMGLKNFYGENPVKFEQINKDLDEGTKTIGSKALPYNKVKIIGYAGMGKTTIIENLVYNEAKKLKENNYDGKIPVIVNMIDVNSKEDTFEKVLASKLDIKPEDIWIVSELIKEKMINLYIDGINEIRISNKDERRQYVSTLDEFIKKSENKKLKVVITDRSDSSESLINDYPTFILSGIKKNDVEAFIKGNSIDPENVNKVIQAKIEAEPKFLNSINNPFMLKQIIEIVECGKDDISMYDSEITKSFIEAIVEREEKIKRDYRAEHIIQLLSYVCRKAAAYSQVTEDGKINLVIPFDVILDLFTEYCDKYNSEDRFDNRGMLTLLVKMGILKEVGKQKYTFANPNYFAYFLS